MTSAPLRIKLAFLTALAIPLAAQSAGKTVAGPDAALVYEGQPISIPLQCHQEHLMGAGLVCNEDSPCELFLELIDLAHENGTLYVIGNVHSAAATVSSLLLQSSDGGQTWTEPVERFGATGFEQIQFADKDHGWIGGQHWDVDLTSSPFLLSTVNGGKRWDRREVWASYDYRSGALLDFYFDSPRHGLLVVDRLTDEGDPYELYESMNGGRSWSIRQVSSEELTIKRGVAVPLAPEWRIQGNTREGSYDIEHARGSEWETVARFSSDVGTCTTMQTGDEEQDQPAEPSSEEPELSEAGTEEPAASETAEPPAEEETEAPSGVFRIPRRPGLPYR